MCSGPLLYVSKAGGHTVHRFTNQFRDINKFIALVSSGAEGLLLIHLQTIHTNNDLKHPIICSISTTYIRSVSHLFSAGSFSDTRICSDCSPCPHTYAHIHRSAQSRNSQLQKRTHANKSHQVSGSLFHSKQI